jgi:hypothetical protein
VGGTVEGGGVVMVTSCRIHLRALAALASGVGVSSTWLGQGQGRRQGQWQG